MKNIALFSLLVDTTMTPEQYSLTFTHWLVGCGGDWWKARREGRGVGLQVYKILFLLSQLENSSVLARKSLGNLTASELWL